MPWLAQVWIGFRPTRQMKSKQLQLINSSNSAAWSWKCSRLGSRRSKGQVRWIDVTCSRVARIRVWSCQSACLRLLQRVRSTITASPSARSSMSMLMGAITRKWPRSVTESPSARLRCKCRAIRRSLWRPRVCVSLPSLIKKAMKLDCWESERSLTERWWSLWGHRRLSWSWRLTKCWAFYGKWIKSSTSESRLFTLKVKLLRMYSSWLKAHLKLLRSWSMRIWGSKRNYRCPKERKSPLLQTFSMKSSLTSKTFLKPSILHYCRRAQWSVMKTSTGTAGIRAVWSVIRRRAHYLPFQRMILWNSVN